MIKPGYSLINIGFLSKIFGCNTGRKEKKECSRFQIHFEIVVRAKR